MDHELCKDCKGFCCDDIGLFTSPLTLKNSYHRWLIWHGKVHYEQEKRMMISYDEGKSPIFEDIHLTYPMLIFTHKNNIHPDGEIINEVSIYHYKCKHHLNNGDCGIYEERPMMCRTFPDCGFCGYKAVTIQEVIDDRPDWFEFGLTNEQRGRVKFGLSPKKPSDDECPTETKAEETE